MAKSTIKTNVVVVATGTTPVIPDISGIDQDNVFASIEVLKGEKEPGDRVVIIGGGRVGCETAEFMVDMGKEVTILEMVDQIDRY